MEICASHPMKDDLSLQEIFRHSDYSEGSRDVQEQIREKSARYRYDYEKHTCFLEKYFPDIDASVYEGKQMLDLGSFTGGRLVYWMQRYKLKEGRGIDVDPIYAQAGNEFAQKNGVNAAFDTGYGETLPYAANSFDFVVSYDVFEHVQSVEQVVSECFRVLKPGGKLLTAFPQFFQPFESHLGLVTKMPALHWFFSGSTLSKVYNEIIQERGPEAYWYARGNSYLKGWEKLPTLNGITVGQFSRIIAANKGWKIVHKSRAPILSDGRQADQFMFRMLRNLFAVPARLPILEELFLGRICWTIEKRVD